MRWCYKTVHYDLKKEGFLGSAFLDEAEVEQSLNEYGQSGWELVSVTETQDGLIAIFKQPLDSISENVSVSRVIPEVQAYETNNEVQAYETNNEGLITDKEIVEPKVKKIEDSSENGLYKIRIE